MTRKPSPPEFLNIGSLHTSVLTNRPAMQFTGALLANKEVRAKEVLHSGGQQEGEEERKGMEGPMSATECCVFLISK